jgi:signal transduction histidine kinase
MDHLESELRITLEENARLQNALADANMRILAMQNGQQHFAGITGSEVYRSLISELDQPLTTISSFCDILLQESVGILGSLQRKFIERIQHSAQSMHVMIDDLSRYAGRDVTAGSTPIEQVNLVELCHSVLNSLSPQFQEKEISLALDLEEPLPLVSIDSQDAIEVIRYLLQNGVNAAPYQGLVHLSMKQDPDSGNKGLLLTVFNSGKGIKEIDITRIFSSIIPDTVNEVPGLGITPKEFSILRMLVEEMDLSLNVISDPLDGTSFILKIPMRSK